MKEMEKIKKELLAAAPENWDKAYIYAYIEGEKGIVECYYVDEENDELFQEEASEELFEYVCDFYDNYREENDEIWYTATFIMEKDGEIDLEIDYSNREQLSDIEKIIVWQYEYLDILPEDEYNYLIEMLEEEENDEIDEDSEDDYDDEELEDEEEY